MELEINEPAVAYETQYSPAGNEIAMPIVKVRSEPSLADKVGKWKSAMTDNATGPLLIASDVVKLADNWDRYRAEAGGLDCDAFMHRHLQRHIFWFRTRHEALRKLGEAIRRYVHHDVAKWLAHSVPREHLDEVKKMLVLSAKARGGHPLTPAQTMKRVRVIIGKATASRVCTRCKKLDALLLKHGIESIE